MVVVSDENACCWRCGAGDVELAKIDILVGDTAGGRELPERECYVEK